MPSRKPEPLTPDSPVTALHGISDTRKKAFDRLGAATLSDLVFRYPRTYENRGGIIPCAQAVHGQTASFLLTVGTQPKVTQIRRGMVLLRFSAFDDSGTCVITFFNQPFLRSIFLTGTVFRFYGRAERTGNRLSLSSPKYEPVPLSDPGDGSSLPALYPVYRLTEGLTQKLAQSAAVQALAVVCPPDLPYPDPLPEELRLRFSLCDKKTALWNIHQPETEAALDEARKRLIFEELLLFSLGLHLRRSLRMQCAAPPMEAPDMQPFFDAQPYDLTGAQKRAVHDFLRDMTAGTNPMNRLLAGDVGSGKTVCAAAALYIAVQNRYQAALMAPTEILARQHFADLAPMFAAFGIPCRLLVGSTRPKEKEEIKAALENGSLPLVIGTHALIEDTVRFRRCGLVITDEQHRFGVGQRAALARKAEHVHTLIMSATPIPRTLALMLFGDLEMSVLDEMPPGRQKVSTFAVDESYRERLNGFIRRQVTEGHQVYIVCPAVEEAEENEEDTPKKEPTLFDTEKPTMKAAVAFAETLSREVFPDLTVGFLHGKMKPAEKDEVMRKFCNRELMILVSTTVIEVGVNVPNATLMVVENAEYFGLSQLHQLRGRVGRGSAKSYCVLVSDADGETARERLKIMCRTNNGYEIAQKDLELRGPGDFFASVQSEAQAADCRQSGGLRFTIASFCDDMALLHDAFSAAGEIVQSDPLLSAPAHLPLKEALQKSFGDIIL